MRGGSKKFEMHPLDTISRGWGTIVLSFCVDPNVMTVIKFVNFIEHTKNMFSIKCNTGCHVIVAGWSLPWKVTYFI